MVRIAASFGDRADEYLHGIEISVDADGPLGHGPTAIAIRENRPVWHQDFQNYPLTAPWHERRARFGLGASASLPLHRNGVPVGVLTLYAGEVGAFDEAARRLLVEMATDISFALDNFAREAARERAEKDRARGGRTVPRPGRAVDRRHLHHSGRQVRLRESALRRDLRLRLGRRTDRPRPVVGGRREQTAAPSRRTCAGCSKAKRRASATTSPRVRKDGAMIEVGVHGARATHHGRPAIIGLMQDISEKKRAEEQIQRYVAQLETAFMSTVEVATTLSEMRDPYTAGHERRVAEIAVAIGAELGFDARRQEGLRVAGYLHDIGKITIPVGDSVQARQAQPDRVPVDPGACPGELRRAEGRRVSLAGGRGRAAAPRAHGRQRLSAGPQGRGDPARGAHHGGGGRGRGDVLAPALPPGAGNRERRWRRSSAGAAARTIAVASADAPASNACSASRGTRTHRLAPSRTAWRRLIRTL